APEVGKQLKPFGLAFLRMIKFLIVPLLASTLIVGIAGHCEDVKTLGKLALRSLIYFEVVTTLALAVGLAMANIFKPGQGVNLDGAHEEPTIKGETLTLESELIKIFPQSFGEAWTHNEILQVVVASILFGVALIQLQGPQKKMLIDITEGISQMMFKVTNIVMKGAPLGIGCAMANAIARSGLGVLVSLAKLVGSLFGALILFVLLILFPIALLFKVPIRDFLYHVRRPVMIAFSTASSDAALPDAMIEMEKLGVPKHVVAFVIPTGYSFNLDGTTLYLAMAALFCAQAGGIQMDIKDQLLIMLTLVISSKGVAAVPRASLVILSSAVSNFGLPMAAVSLIFGVDQIMDMARTTVNLFGNCLATVVLSIWEGSFRKDPEWINANLAAAGSIDEEAVQVAATKDDASPGEVKKLDEVQQS
ncbi:hypothetical protein HK102_006618, partial [Quaeritorhiza haematococci]